MCHVPVRLQFRSVIIPLYQKEVMHTKETPNHHVRGAINHLLLNIKRATECPVGKQEFHHLPIAINFAFILGEDEGEHGVWGTQLQMTPDLSHRHDSCLTVCTGQCLPSHQHICCCCPSWSHGVQKTHTGNSAEIASMLLLAVLVKCRFTKTKEWRSGIVGSSGSKGPFCLPALVLPASERTSWEELKEALHILFPWQVPKSILTILQTTC